MSNDGMFSFEPGNNPSGETSGGPQPASQKSEGAEAAKAPESQSTEFGKLTFGSAFSRFAGEVASIAREKRDEVLAKTADLATRAGQRIADGAVATHEAIQSAGQATLDAATAAKQRIADTSVYVAAKSLEHLAGDPTKPRTTSGEATKIAPILGPLKSYAEAWSLYHHSKEIGSEDGMHLARVKCVIAMAEGGIDMGAFTAVKFARTPTALREALIAASSAKAVHSLEDMRSGLAVKLAERVLSSAGTAEKVTKIFEAVKPTKSWVPSQEADSSENAPS